MPMEALCESAKLYANTLKKCSLPQVAEWKFSDVQRARKWDAHFKKVQISLSNKLSVRRKMDVKLHEIGRELGVRFGEEELSYDFLAHSFDYFVKCLLDNPALSEELRVTLSELSPVLTQKHLSEVEENKLLLSSLTAISDQLASCCHGDDDDDDFPCDLELLNAAYLRKDLHWILDGNRVGVWRRLDSLVRVDGGMETILIALLQDESNNLSRDGPSHLDRLDLVRRALFDWLMQAAQQEDRPGPSRTRPVSEVGGRDGGEERTPPEPVRGEPEVQVSSILWKSSHCKLLAKVSLRYFEFFKEHFKFLVRVTKAVEKARLESCLAMDLHVHSTEQAGEMGLLTSQEEQDIELSQIEEMELSQIEDMELSQVEEMELSERPSRSLPPGTLDEQVEWVTTHWVALSLVGGQPRTVCLSFLTKESKQVPQAVQDELSHGGCVLKLRPPKGSVWNTVLKSVLTACEYNHCTHSGEKR